VVEEFDASFEALALAVAIPKREISEIASMIPKLRVESTKRPLRVNLIGETATGARVVIKASLSNTCSIIAYPYDIWQVESNRCLKHLFEWATLGI
jgi:hypothetical protein